MDVQISMPPPPPPPPPPPFFAETTAPQLTVPPPPPPPQPVTTTTATASVASPPTQDRIWLHPWTVTEMRENASQWSLAGDAGVLLYLENFSDKLIQRADTIQQHLSQTVNAVKSTHTRVQNCLNEFTSLANTQFIENRVYDEDETANATPSKKDEQSSDKANVSNTEAQEKVLQRYVEAIQYGLTILDTHFERVDSKLENGQNIGASFADDDEDGGVPLEPILEPKDPYIFRPLPYLIGTTEFMEDDYVGLGDLLNTHDEGAYDVVKIKNEDPDSALSSSDDDEEEEEGDDFQAEVSTAPIVPAGASRPDLSTRAPTRVSLTDSEDEDDPFGMNVPKFNVFSTEKSTTEDNLFEEPKIPTKPKKPDFTEESDDEESGMFGITTISKPPPPIVENIDNESTKSKDSSDTEESNHMGGVSMFGGAPQKGMSELEKAVLRRRQAMGDTDLPPNNDSDEDEITKKPPKPLRTETISSLVNKPTKKASSESPSSSTISNLTSQPLTKPDQSPKPTIFGGHKSVDDDDEDLFSDAPKLKSLLPSTTVVDTKSSTVNPPKEVKGIFDNDTDEDDDPFTIKKKTTPLSKPITKVESNSKIQPVSIIKPALVIRPDDSDEDEALFVPKKTQPKKIPTVSTTTVIEKPKSPSSDDDLFPTPTVTKPQVPPPTTKTSDDEEPVFVNKPPVRQSVVPSPIPTVVPKIKKPVSTAETDSENELFGITKTKLETPATKLSKPTEAEKSLGTSTNRPTTNTQKIISPIKLDDDDDDPLFSSKPTTKLPPPVVLPPLPTSPSVKIATYEDPLSGIRTPAETTPKPPTVVEQKKASTSDSDEESSHPKRGQNKAAVEDGKKPNVKDILKNINIPVGALRPGVRPKARPVVEEPLQPSLDDEEHIQKVEAPPANVKKSPKLDSDSEDDLFTTKKKSTPTAQIVDSGKNRMNKPAASVKPISDEDDDSNNTPAALPTETRNKESIVDENMVKISTDRFKVVPKNRTPQTRKARTATAASANEDDDLFALPNNVTSSPPTTAPVLAPPPTIVKKTLKSDPDSGDDLFNTNKKPTSTAPVLPSSPAMVKKSPELDPDSDDDLFNTNKKPTSTAPVVDSGRVSVKDLSSRMKIPMMPASGTQPKPTSNTDNTTTAPPTEEPTADKTMLNIFNDRVKVSNKNRTPPTRNRTATAASANEDDDLFASPNATSNVSSPAVPSTVPVTGLPNTAAISAKQTNLKEKKKFSLFDSDDSDIDELLFGFNKKNKSSVTSKPTTTASKATTKAALPPIDDDDNDFLSKRPIKKNAKPMDSDDIFADVKSKGPPANKAKKDWSILEKPAGEKDDIFNDMSTAPTKSSAASKSKSTNVKSKSTKDLDDIFDDPLNVLSKR